MLDADFLRYKLKSKGIKIKDLAAKLKCSSSNINYRFKTESLSVKEIFIILEMTELKFEEVFVNGNE
jgi:AraC-like DNA-binding protein